MMVAPRLLRRAALVLCLGLCDSQGRSRTKPPTAAPTGTNAPSQEPTAKPTWAMDAVRNDRVPHVSTKKPCHLTRVPVAKSLAVRVRDGLHHRQGPHDRHLHVEPDALGDAVLHGQRALPQRARALRPPVHDEHGGDGVRVGLRLRGARPALPLPRGAVQRALVLRADGDLRDLREPGPRPRRRQPHPAVLHGHPGLREPQPVLPDGGPGRRDEHRVRPRGRGRRLPQRHHHGGAGLPLLGR